MRPPAIPHPRCSLDVIFVCLQIFCSAGYQMHPWRLRSFSRNSRHGWRKCIIWIGKESVWLPSRWRPDTTQEQLDTTFTKVTKCGYGIRNVDKDSLRSYRRTEKVLTQS
ncbi:hypothetical protein TNCV_4423621 [Trichonephila clavipes]|nr:hypothetical protein TNCV_4423621 [Trichonephila clavipes]